MGYNKQWKGINILKKLRQKDLWKKVIILIVIYIFITESFIYICTYIKYKLPKSESSLLKILNVIFTLNLARRWNVFIGKLLMKTINKLKIIANGNTSNW